MNIFFSVGEPSGDLHGANLIRQLKARDASIECVGFGGPRMAEAGCKIHFDLTQLAIMFLGRALANLPTFLRLLRSAQQYMSRHRVDAVVLIDYPGFNWWIARAAKRRGIPVYFYGAPQMWAWGPWRVKKLRKYVDHVLCKLPFEAAWFQQRGCSATYIGHPYFDQLQRYQMDQQFLKQYGDDRTRLLTLLPGSRNQEIKLNLPSLLAAARQVQGQVENIAVAVACLNEKQAQRVRQQVCQLDLPFDVMAGRTAELIQLSDVCLACSGSVSLELMYYRRPTVIVYRLTRWLWLLKTIFLRVRYVTLVNLLWAESIERPGLRTFDPQRAPRDSEPMPEFVTVRDCSQKMSSYLVDWLNNREAREERVQLLSDLADRYARGGASRRAADYIFEQLSEQHDAGKAPRRAAA